MAVRNFGDILNLLIGIHASLVNLANKLLNLLLLNESAFKVRLLKTYSRPVDDVYGL